jgi:lipopolysaccharide export system protein LptA
MKVFVLALLAIGFAGLAQAQNLVSGSKEAPVEISAEDGIEWQRDAKAYVARGNARAVRSGVAVYADTLTAFYRDGKDGEGQDIFRIDADGSVRIESKSEKAFGDKGVYHVRGQFTPRNAERLDHGARHAGILGSP